MSIESIFLKNDIRGVYNTVLTNDLGQQIGNHFSPFSGGTVVIGGDSRLSTPALKSAIIHGLTDAGIDVYDLGLVPTPVIYYTCATNEDITAGIVVTASHNPKEYNGIKLCDSTGAAYTFDTAYKSILQAIQQQIPYHHTAEKGKVLDGSKYVVSYVNYLQQKFRYNRSLKILVEYGNGAASLFQHVVDPTIEVTALHATPDGNFPYFIPDPTKLKNYKYIQFALKNNNYDVAISFDGDGDRVGFMTGTGNLIPADHVISTYARELAKEQSPEIMIDVKVSNSVVRYVEQLGGKVIYTQVGHSWVHENLLHSSAAFAGELSGHYYFALDYYGFDDALYAALYFLKALEHLLDEGQSLDSLIASYPQTFASDEIREHVSYNRQAIILAKLREYIDQNNGKLIAIDGVRGEFADGWFIARTSGTEELLSYRVEGLTKSARNNYLGVIQSIIATSD